MTTSPLTVPSGRTVRPGTVVAISLMIALAYAIPLIGPVASLALPFALHAWRRQLWPDASGRSSRAWACAAWVGLWTPALLFLTAVLVTGEDVAGADVSTAWLLLPLCAPSGLDAVLLPALVAGGTVLLAVLAGATSRGGGRWVVAGAWLAPWAHHLVLTQTGQGFVC